MDGEQRLGLLLTLIESVYVMAKVHQHYEIKLCPEPEGGFTAIVSALPGYVTYGRTLTEAKGMVKDAIDCYIESLKKHKELAPISRS